MRTIYFPSYIALMMLGRVLQPPARKELTVTARKSTRRETQRPFAGNFLKVGEGNAFLFQHPDDDRNISEDKDIPQFQQRP